MPIKDLIHQKFGRLTVIKYIGLDKNRAATWLCKCNCGQITIVIGHNLGKGATKSCGCLKREIVSKRMTKHGYSRTKIYKIWHCIIQRCTNPNAPRYGIYGGRGITICKRWLKFENFLKDMGEAPTKNYSIDRIDNDKGYCKENCRWATYKQQQRNKRTNHLITFHGQTKCLAEWCEKLDLSYGTIQQRLAKLNWSVKKALTTPTLEQNKSITFNNKCQSLAAWAKELKINHDTLRYRLYRANWPIKKALTTPIRKTKHH